MCIVLRGEVPMNQLKYYRLDNASGKSKEPQGSGSEKCLQAEP